MPKAPYVSVTAEGVRVSGWMLRASLRGFIKWIDIQTIEVERISTGGVEQFRAILWDGISKSVAVFDDYAGFDNFRTAMFERWPQIEKEWTRVFCGSPNSHEHVTVWNMGED